MQIIENPEKISLKPRLVSNFKIFSTSSIELTHLWGNIFIVLRMLEEIFLYKVKLTHLCGSIFSLLEMVDEIFPYNVRLTHLCKISDMVRNILPRRTFWRNLNANQRVLSARSPKINFQDGPVRTFCDPVKFYFFEVLTQQKIHVNVIIFHNRYTNLQTLKETI